ncbi:MAG TPA: hypothetical protein VIW67_11170, partial [Terriglobales bacterium]
GEPTESKPAALALNHFAFLTLEISAKPATYSKTPWHSQPNSMKTARAFLLPFSLAAVFQPVATFAATNRSGSGQTRIDSISPGKTNFSFSDTCKLQL